MIWVDASVWLEIALGQSRAKECEHFLEQAQKEPLFTSDFDVYSIILTMLKHKKTADDVKTFLGVLAGFSRLTIFRPPALIIFESLGKMQELRLTLDDCLAFASMQHLGIRKLATLDSDFRKLDVELVLGTR